MTKSCPQCQQSFTIYPEDKDFYQKINVPEPKMCPQCRNVRRLAFRNERALYQRKCDLCKREIISFYSLDKKYIQYCPDCWWSDKWQAPELAYNPQVDFFKQFDELMHKTPHLALVISHGENSDYCPHSVNYKNSYMCVSGVGGENLYYTYYLNNSRDCLDCALGYDLEKCYECVHCNNLFSSIYCVDCENSSELAFCFDCASCHNCLGCAGLRHKDFYVFNEKATEQGYNLKLKEAKANPQKFLKEFETFSLKFPRIYARILHSEKCTGDYIYNSQNSRFCFEVNEQEHCVYIWNAPRKSSDTYDCNYAPNNELTYNCMSPVNCTDVMCSVTCWDASFLKYCWQCFYSKNLFGCVGIKHGEFMILNKKYSEDEYKKIITHIEKQMRQSGEWGEFFPAKISPFAYNETIAQYFFPVNKEKAITNGFSWHEEEKKVKTKADLSICVSCKRNFRLMPQELEFYDNLGLPKPKKCHQCRYLERMRKISRVVYQRQCAQCGKEIQTVYAPERPEIIYCEQCYNKEIY